MKPEELGIYLSTMRNVIANDLRPALKSVHLNAAAGAIVTMLDRLVTTLKNGEQDASARRCEWEQIKTELERLGFATDVPVKNASAADELESRLAAIQRAIGRGAPFEKMATQLSARDPNAERWFARTVAALVSFYEAGEPQVPPPPARSAAEPVDETDALREKLTAYLRRRFPALPKDPIQKFAIAPGGHVKQTSLFSLAPNDLLPTRLVLRRDLALSITGTSVIDEYPIIDRVHALGLPVPKPVFLEPDPAPLNGTFMVMTEVEDAVGAGTYFPEERKLARRTTGPNYGREVASFLARLHRGTAKKAGSGIDFNRHVKEHYEKWCALRPPPYSVAMDIAYIWLLSHPLSANRPECLIHGDVGSHNIMVRNGSIAAVLDWELAHEADPAEDLAQCRMMLLPDTMPWREFAKEYIAAGGDPAACDESAVAYYCVWTYVKHGFMNSTVRNLYLNGERDDMTAAIVAGHYYHRLMQYQGRALQIAVDASGIGGRK